MDYVLNTQQEEAANHKGGPCLVTACPGSGKTATAVERTARLIQSGVDPASILSITFTNKAAEMWRQRVFARLGEPARLLTICTIHAWCAKCLRRYGHILGYGNNMVILDEDEQVSLLAQIARQLLPPQNDEENDKAMNRKVFRQLASKMDDCREKLFDEDEMQKVLDKEDYNWFPIAQEYLKQLQPKNRIDFSGLLTEVVRLLTTKPEVLKAVQDRFKYFQVDEAQDTNVAQFEIIRRLGSGTRNIMVIGDFDQSIYAFRGARPENLTDFISEYNPRVIRLGQNYRSSPEIVAVANKLIRHNPGRISDDFRTENPSGAAVECRRFATSEDEARWIAEQARIAITNGTPPKKIAVLYRLNRLSRAIEMALMAQRVNYVVVGGLSFFDRAEIKDVLSMSRLLLNPSDNLAFQRIANKPRRSLGDSAVAKLEKFAEEQQISILEACKRAKECLKTSAAIQGAGNFAEVYNFEWREKPLSEVLRTLSDRLRYTEHLLHEDADKQKDRTENIGELIAYATKFGTTEKSLSGFLDQITLMTSVDKADKKNNAVILQTGHSCKGLEYDTVFAPCLEAGILPSSRSIEEDPNNIFEERRLAYVIFSRAERRLRISYCGRRLSAYGRKQENNWAICRPSQFLYEAGLLKNPDCQE